MIRWVAAIGLAALITVGTVAPVAAERIYVNVTNVTIDPVARLRANGFSPAFASNVSVSGTITCDGDGHIGWVAIDVYQDAVHVTENLSLVDYPCTTEPTSWLIYTDSFGSCTRETRKTECLHIGFATVIARDFSSCCGPYPAWEQTVRIRRAK